MIHRYIIEATDEVKGFEEAIERLDREWGIEELDPCEDAISRKAAIDAMVKIEQDDIGQYGSTTLQWLATRPAIEALNELPSVTPHYTDAEIQKMQEMEQVEIQKAYELGKASRLKVGHWIKKKPYPMLEYDYECSECGHSDCGAKMESEAKK